MTEKPKPESIRIYVNITPSPDDPPDAPDFYLALGMAMVAWGRLEGHFVSCLLMIMPIANDPRIGRKLPMRWEKRAEIWGDAFSRIPDLKHHKTKALAFLNQLDEITDFRNFISHALWEFFKSDYPILAMDAVKIKAKDKASRGIDAKRRIISLNDLANFTAKANRLNIELLKISMALSALIPPPPSDVHKL